MRFDNYDKNKIYSESNNYPLELRDKIDIDKNQNQLKNVQKEKEFEEYSNYLKQRNYEFPENGDKLNSNFKEEKFIKNQNYNQNLDNFSFEPSREENIQPKSKYINYSQVGRNYQRGYSHGYNILTGEIFSSPTSNPNNINSQIIQNNNNRIIREENFPSKNTSNIPKEADYLTYMEILRKKEIEQNNNNNNKKDYIPPDYNKLISNENESLNKMPSYGEKSDKSYHTIESSLKNQEIKNELSQMSRPISQNLEKKNYNILDSSNNEYLLNKQKNMLSNNDIYSGKSYFQTQYKQNTDELNPKFGKREKQREYAKILEGQINSKKIYEETYKNLSKNSDPQIERFRNRNMMIFGGMSPFQQIKERNNKLNDIPRDPYSNHNYNINSSFLNSNIIANTGNEYEPNINKGRRRVVNSRFANNGNIIIGK